MGRDLLRLKGIRPVMAAMAGLTLIQSIAIILQAKWLAEVITALFAGEPLREQYGTTVLFLLAFTVRQLTVLLQQRTAYRFGERTGSALRQQLMDKLFRLGPRFAKTEGTGKLVTLVLDGISKFKAYLELFLPRMLATGLTPGLILLFVYMKDLTSGIILTLTLPILIIFLILVGLTARRQTERQMKSYRVLSNHFVDSLRGLETLKYLGRSKDHARSIGTVSDDYRSATMKTLRVAFLSSFALDFFTMMSVAVVAVGLGLRLINGHIDLLPALTVLILAPEYFLPVRMVGADFHATMDGKEAGEVIQHILATTSEEEAEASSVEADASSLNWTEESQLILSSLSVRHAEGVRSSLEEVSFHIQGLARIGIIGESGAGKSTLIDVLGGFLSPTSGTVSLNGSVMNTLALEVWRQQITYIPQSPYLFSGTLAENIRFYTPDASLADVQKAVQAAGLSELVQSLPDGLDEQIGGGGRPLSGGQEQRVALARAFLSDRPVILLDEPTAHLDIETEYELKQTMLPLFQNKLILLATHRMHWMKEMDTIIVLSEGKVAEIGTHEELLAREGAYYGLLRAEREGVE
ncbi:thiol reductant ABC exporter subunit CydD [Paenibacillus sp. CAA11]|uniref:thiol reductant ABC exporter subunit CydD n=1 Tax=Paenibacillus sp. CAA11 TaxID=1532905 RepID=UPI000D3916BC|nr:thiol reductant ABC exporter subunit CydD [Paenibacillus sp. CAA11]AWB46360.1 thiol reductant ABC exporter subunit CydD [Paenibacillus sp. CAA11]